MNKHLYLILTILFILGCGLSAPATRPPQPTQTSAIEQPVQGLTAQEAWLAAKSEVSRWAADAALSEEWVCQGVVFADGRCSKWYGLIGSATLQQAASLQVKETQVSLRATAALGRALDEPFSLNGVLDSPEVVQRATLWLASHGLKSDKTKVRGLAVRSDSNALRNCNSGSVSLTYNLDIYHPEGRLCVDPFNGQVTYNSYGK